MALLWADGFDHYGNAGEMGASGVYLYAYNDWQPLISIGNARTGPGCLRLSTDNNGSSFVQRSLNANPAVIGQGFALLLNGTPAFNPPNRIGAYFWRGDGAPLLSIAPNDRLGLTVFRGDTNSEVIAESRDNILVLNSFQHIEIKAFLDLAVGYVEVRVNGSSNPAILAVDLPTIPYAGTAARAGFYKPGGLNSGQPAPIFVDDWTVWDATGDYCNDFIGDNRCRTRFADTDGVAQQWAVDGAATAHEAVSNVPPAAAHLVGEVGDVSTFGLSAIPTNLAYCAGVVAFMNVNKTNAGECEVNLSLISDDGESVKVVANPGTGYAMYAGVIQQAPGGAVWTIEELLAAQAKLERVS